MKRSMRLLIIIAFLMTACVPTPEQYTDLEARLVDPVGTRSVLIQVDYGEVVVSGSDDPQISVGGQVLFVDELEYSINSTAQQTQVKVFANRESSFKVPLRVVIRLPQELHVRIETNNASVLIQDWQGDLQVASTSGDITLERVSGALMLHSNRGDVTVRESTGSISVVGNYGALSTQNVRGNTSISTIMGNIAFGGLVAGDDSVRLETDHGSVSVGVSADSAVTLHVSSTSGDVTCMLPGLNASTRTCSGVMHSGDGRLSVRTVSGAVTLQLIP